jgi:hypothetical protein
MFYLHKRIARIVYCTADWDRQPPLSRQVYFKQCCSYGGKTVRPRMNHHLDIEHNVLKQKGKRVWTESGRLSVWGDAWRNSDGDDGLFWIHGSNETIEWLAKQKPKPKTQTKPSMIAS